jgi:hypothetical protein
MLDLPTPLPARPTFDQASYQKELLMEHEGIDDCSVVTAEGTGSILYRIEYVEPITMKDFFVIADETTGTIFNSIGYSLYRM